RRKLLEKHPRARGVLDLAAEKSGWGKPPPSGRARGVAVYEAFGSFVAEVAEVSLSKGRPRVHRVGVAVDCGPVLHPNRIRQQMESGGVFGLSAALFQEITFAKGRVQQSAFHDYPTVRMNEAPEVETHIVASTGALGGIGEVAVPGIAPAVTNA